MDNFEIAVRIDKLNDELNKAIGILVQMPITYEKNSKARNKLADVSVELDKLVDELNKEDK